MASINSCAEKYRRAAAQQRETSQITAHGSTASLPALPPRQNVGNTWTPSPQAPSPHRARVPAVRASTAREVADGRAHPDLPAVVIAGFPGVGKSTFCRQNPKLGTVDSNSSQYSKKSGANSKDWVPTYVQEHVIENLFRCDVIFTSNHLEVRDELLRRGIALTLVYPHSNLYEEYERRYSDRQTPPALQAKILDNWDNYLDLCAKQRGVNRVVLQSGEGIWSLDLNTLPRALPSESLLRLQARSEAIASAPTQTSDAELREQAIASYVEAYESALAQGEQYVAMGSDFARRVLPAVFGFAPGAIGADDMPLFYAATSALAAAVDRKGFARLLAAHPSLPLVMLQGAPGAGKSTLLNNLGACGLRALTGLLPGRCLIKEGAFLEASKLVDELMPVIRKGAPDRTVHLIGVAAPPQVCAERIVQRAFATHADRPEDCRIFPEFLLGGYDVTRRNFRSWCSLPADSNVRFHVVSTEEGSVGRIADDTMSASQALERIDAAVPNKSPDEVSQTMKRVVLARLDALDSAAPGSTQWCRRAFHLPHVGALAQGDKAA